MSYRDSIKQLLHQWPIKEGSILITGSTGLIGSCVIDSLIESNTIGSKFKIYALSRSEERIKKRFGCCVIPVVQDIVDPLKSDIFYDYIIHCASNADPRSYATKPVETILTNIIGTKNILDYCKVNTNTRMLFASTFEVYGMIEGTSVYSENITGVIDINIIRNGYPESKRTSELLLKSYVDEYSVNAVIARLPSVYGPTMTTTDSKAHAQFIHNALKGENIVLKSKGDQLRTYCYVIDAVSGIIKILFEGRKGEAYNISNEKSIASIADVAQICAKIAGTKVILDLPDKIEEKGYSKPQNCILDNTKLKHLGWTAKYSLEDGLRETIDDIRI